MKFLVHILMSGICSCTWNSSEVYPSSPAHFHHFLTFPHRAWCSRASQLRQFFSISQNAGDCQAVDELLRAGRAAQARAGWQFVLFPAQSWELLSVFPPWEAAIPRNLPKLQWWHSRAVSCRCKRGFLNSTVLHYPSSLLSRIYYLLIRSWW